MSPSGTASAAWHFAIKARFISSPRLKSRLHGICQKSLPLGNLTARNFVLDGELVVPVDKVLDFDQLLQASIRRKAAFVNWRMNFPHCSLCSTCLPMFGETHCLTVRLTEGIAALRQSLTTPMRKLRILSEI
jgi:hypothetical protein